ncbi:MAG: hypothetical protein V1898_04855 [Patescibacteria group bacterium]
MKKTLLLLALLAVFTAGCAQTTKDVVTKNTNVTPEVTKEDQNVSATEVKATVETRSADTATFMDEANNISFSYPADWKTKNGSIDCATVYEFDTLKLIEFTECPATNLGGEMLSATQTYSRFINSFTLAEVSSDVETPNATIAVISYANTEDNGVYAMSEDSGTVAIWQMNKMSFALLDENNIHQADGTFMEILKSIAIPEVTVQEITTSASTLSNYSNSKYNFSFAYPGNYSVTEEVNNTSPNSTDTTLELVLTNSSNSNNKFTMFVDHPGMGVGGRKDYKDAKKITISGQEISIYYTQDESPEYDNILLYAKWTKGDNEYIALMSDSDYNNKEKVETVFESILASWK